MKKCSKCKCIKHLSEFDKDNRSSSGYFSSCKSCRANDFKAKIPILVENLSYRYSYAQSHAKRRKIPFTINENEYGELIKMPCHYCGEFSAVIGIQLDRKSNDKSIGYTINNVLPCCGRCNKVRSNHFTVEETKVAIQAVLEFRKSQ